MAEVLAKQPRPRGPSLTIVTNAGGPGVLATDALIGGGGELAELSAETIAALRRASCRRTGATATRSTSSATPTPERYAQGAGDRRGRPGHRRPAGHPDAAGDDRPDRDGRAAHAATRTSTGKPVLASLDGRPRRRGGRGDPATGPASRPSPIPTPPRAIFNYMWRSSDNLRGLYETPDAGGRRRDARLRPRRGRGDHRRGPGRRAGRSADRGRVEAGARRLRHPDDRDRASRHDRGGAVAAAAAHRLSRWCSSSTAETITHKTDVGGVQLEPGRRRRGARARSRRSRTSVAEQRGAEHFHGVTVQPMVRLRRLRADRRQQSSTRSSARCCSSARAASWSRCSATERSACRR